MRIGNPGDETLDSKYITIPHQMNMLSLESIKITTYGVKIKEELPFENRKRKSKRELSHLRYLFRRTSN